MNELNDILHKTSEKKSPENEIDREAGFYSIVNMVSVINKKVYETHLDKNKFSSKDESNSY